MSTMDINISSDHYCCKIRFERHFIVIKGDSGIGKTELVELISESARDVKIESTLPCVPLTGATWKDLMRFGENRIYIADDQEFVETREFASIFKESVKKNNYFVFICRADTIAGRLGALSFSANDIYRFVGDGKDHYIEPMYPPQKLIASNADCFLVEDTAAGYEFFSDLVHVDCKCATDGKSSIVKDLAILSKSYKHIFVIVDMASYGCHMEEFYTICNRKIKIKISYMSDYECFEELLLRTNLLKDLSIVKREMNDLPKYAGRFLSWEKYFEDLLKRATSRKFFAQSHGAHINPCYTKSCLDCNVHKMEKCKEAFHGEDKFCDLLIGTKYEDLLQYHN